MPGGRKPKIDGAYQDLTLKPIPGSDEYGGYKAQEDQIAAVKQEVEDTMGMPTVANMPQFQPQDIFRTSEREEESGLQNTNMQEVVPIDQNTNTQILIDMIKEQSDIAKLRF